MHVLRYSQTLTTLDLAGNSIGAQGVQYIADALEENRVRCFLHVSIIRLLYSLFLDTHKSVP